MRWIGAKGFVPFASACLLSGALMAANAQTETQPQAQRPSGKELHDAAGDIASDPGPIDTSLSPKLTREDVQFFSAWPLRLGLSLRLRTRGNQHSAQ